MASNTLPANLEIHCPKYASEPMITVFEKFVERPDGVYYLWRVSGEKIWREKLTAHKETPYVQWKVLSSKEFEMLKRKGE